MLIPRSVTNSYEGRELNTEVHIVVHHLRCAFSRSLTVHLWALFFRGEYQHYEAPRSPRKCHDHVRPSSAPDRLATTNLHIYYRELAINPPLISFSSLRSFNWGPVTIPIQIDGTA